MSDKLPNVPRRRRVLDDLKPYIQGSGTRGDEEHGVKLSFNESPYGPAPEARQAYIDASNSIGSYGDGQQTALREALAKVHDLPAENILCGNGSDELISLLIRAFLDSGNEIVLSENGFVNTRTHAIVAGAKIVSVVERNWTVDVEAVLAAISPETRIVSICNPNNPAGTFVDRSDLRQLADSVPSQVILHIDEAYAEYAMPEPGFESVVDWKLDQQNLVVTRTFSKAYGLAGLRIGWLAAHLSVVDAIDRFRTPFNANTAAQVTATAALECQDWLRQVVTDNRNVRNEFVARLIKLGLEVIPSVTNFVLIRFPPETGKSGSDAYRALEAQGYLARPTESRDAYLRITMGTAQQMEDVARIIDQHVTGDLL